MKKLISSALCLLALGSGADAQTTRPKLVVGIVVDQLRTDYIEFLQSHFGEGGFRKLMNGGAYMRDVDFKVSVPDAASATAMLYTGAYPSQTGIATAYLYDPATRRAQPALTDVKTLGNFTDDAFSPANLRLSTLADELAVEGSGLSAIYAFAADPQQALIMAGHSGTSGCWINTATGNWATTTYYKGLPQPLSSRNYSHPLSARIDTMQWKPSISPDKFPGLPEHKKLYPFRHTFPRSDKNVYERFSVSALANVEVTDVAIECLKNLKIGGSGNGVDMLNVAYTLAPYRYVQDGDYRVELTDSYLRLDKQLRRLFEAIDKYVGVDNTVIWLSSTGYYDDAVIDDKKYRIPTGEFSMKRARSLLNSFLSARHGNAAYVEAFRDGHIYFDHKVFEEKNLDINDMVQDARSFLAKMSGVADAYTLEDILSPGTPEEERLRLLIDPKTGGDLFVTFNPGWTVVDDQNYPETSKPVRESPVCSPAFIMGGGVAPQIISEPVDATALAPTVAGILRIRSPNGSRSKPVLLNLAHGRH